MATKHISTGIFILNPPMSAFFLCVLFLFPVICPSGRGLGIKYQMMDMVKNMMAKPVTEVHIVGGVHPKMNLYFFRAAAKIKAHRPDLHIKDLPHGIDYMHPRLNHRQQMV
jgi:hypothetical protein